MSRHARPPAAPAMAPDRAAAIAAAIEAWFPAAARVLPWRTARSGWAALVSEAMLQQTQVARVVPAFEAFMRRFPTPAALAAAPEQEVLAAWQGLGYYRRARMLQQAAAAIVAEHGGEVPRDAETLRTLPGVGRYTAGAVASIAFRQRAPIVDGNVRRVTARIEGDARPIEDAAAERETWARAEALVAAAADPAILNEGLMELGATVCTPAAPRCGNCPLAEHCRAAAAGTAASIPPPKVRGRRQAVHYHVVLIRRGPSVLMEPRPDGGLWAGLWQPPTVESASPLPWTAVAERLSVNVHDAEERGGFLHRTTHRDVHFRVWTAASRGRRGRWVDAEGLGDLPVGNGHRRAITLALDPA
ncbi:MAG: A/G-specific adenine glycosylase [Planctomycetota bacterium]